ncbi:MAG: sulfurtransferase [Bacteroidota bacterium]
MSIHKNADVLIFNVRTGKSARAGYEAEHLSGAVFVDLNSQLAAINSDVSIGGRHPLPDQAVFAKTLTDLGISKRTHVIVYDDANGSNAAARFWWMLKWTGHDKVQVINGGLEQARKSNFPMRSGTETNSRATEPYTIEQLTLPTVTMPEVKKAAQHPDYLVIDVRSKERFDGITEPIDLVAGHIPGAINIPFTENLDPNGLFLKPGELKSNYEKKFGDVKSERMIVHCGSGVTACHTLLALSYAGMEIPGLYVGSWSEWSRGLGFQN